LLRGNEAATRLAWGNEACQAADSFSGDISNCFDVKPEHGKYSLGSRLQGTRAEGTGHVRIKTMSGDVLLCDRN
jgi:hypothetical protein